MNDVMLDRLKEIVSAVMYAAEAPEVEMVLERIAGIARELAGTRYAALGVPDDRGGLRFFKTSGMTQEEITRLDHLPRGHGLLGVLLRERDPLIVDHMRDDPRSVGFPSHHPYMDSLLGVPIQLGQRLFGILYLCDKEDGTPFNEQDQLLIETLAGYAALTIAGAELGQQQSRLKLLEERERISMELHDGVIQSLYAIGMHVELLRMDGSATPQALTNIIANLNEVIEDIREYILDLRTRSSQRVTVRQCLEDVRARLRMPSHMEVVIDAPDERPPFQPSVFESLCLIVNEALSNAVRHSQATHIHITAHQSDRIFQIVVRDNGQGFDVDTMRRNHGLGLRNMQQRARLYGGEVRIDSKPGEGTLLFIQIPVKTF